MSLPRGSFDLVYGTGQGEVAATCSPIAGATRTARFLLFWRHDRRSRPRSPKT